MSDKNASTAIPFSSVSLANRAWLIAGLIGLAGAALSVGLFLSLRASERNYLEHVFQAQAWDRIEVIQRGFEMRVASLETLGQLCGTRQGIAADEFRNFAANMQRDPAMKGVMWIPRTSAGEGIDQFRIACAEPLRENEALLGQDVSSSTGLGLTIVSQLVRQMGGRIWVESTAGEGTTFHFTARFGVDRAARLPEVSGRAFSVSEVTRPGSGLCILLAEDNVINSALATGILTKRGHVVTHAANGCEAVAAASAGVFDLIFMDVQMPQMDGFEATRRIREIEEPLGRHTPIVAMTAHAMAGDRERCLASGMDDYISKPLEKSELLALLARMEAEEVASVADHSHTGLFSASLP